MNLAKGKKNNKDLVMYVQDGLSKLPYGEHIEVDGKYGKQTEGVVKDFQLDHNLVVTGIFGIREFATLLNPQKDKKLFVSEEKIKQVAIDLKVQPEHIKAIYKVEARGVGFLGGKPKILFEGHKFWHRLREHGVDPKKHRNDPNLYGILYRKHTYKHYKGGLKEWGRLYKAIEINELAALESASWGLFQIMGFNYKRLGYSDVKKYVDDCYDSEDMHLEHLSRFIATDNRLVGALRRNDWAGFAKVYNGPLYWKHGYDKRLEREFKIA